MNSKKYKLKIRNITFSILILIFTIGFFISVYNIIKWKLDNDKINKQIDKIYNNVEINETIDDNYTKIIEQTDQIQKSNPYWDFIKMNLIDVDFKKLKSINSSTKGWIKINGTNINYPFVQDNDNEYYLNHSFDKSYNKAGWVFLDYRNNIKLIDKNTIIYAHSRLDNTMFGSLKKILKNSWYDNPNNHVIRMSTEHHNTLWQIFSIYIINTTNDYIKVSFDNKEFKDFGQMLLERSKYNFNTSINEDDKILTLSTCYNKTKKVVMHAKLIKIKNK
ncbi:MAG: class B sortase [Bacilli bacterium]